jgi:hypothetical protein
MGQQKKVLVVMTNGDVYYLDSVDVGVIQAAMITKSSPIVRVVDMKSRSKITLHIRNVSSLVEEVSHG